MSQQVLPPPNTARLAITSLCNVLRHHGITSLEPELVRQAKFDGPVAAPLWHVLHDTVLVVLSGCPPAPACAAALSRQWDQISLELIGSLQHDDTDFPHEGATLVIRQLAVWGAPPDLLRELEGPGDGGVSEVPGPNPDLTGPTECGGDGGAGEYDVFGPECRSGSGPRPGTWPRCRSRPLLLALGWLVAAAGLFERRIGELEPGPGLRALLPPYPPDTCVGPAVQAAYDRAARDAQEHVGKLAPTAAAPGTTAASACRAAAGARGRGGGGGGGDPFGSSSSSSPTDALWAEVETATQRAVMLCGRVRSRLVALQAATDCRIRFSHSLWSRQAAAAPSSRPLMPYELQLCAQPGTMQRHMAALETATLALLEQQELAAHGALFFEWLGSVIEEEKRRRLQHQQKRRPEAQQRQAGGRRGGDGAGAGGPLESLERLPYIGSDAGARLAAHLESQLEATVHAVEPELEAARRRAEDRLRQGGGAVAGGGARGTPAAGTAAGAGGGPRAAGSRPQHPPFAITLDHFLAMAEQAVSEQQLGVEAWDVGVGGGNCSGDGGSSAAVGSPLLVGGGSGSAADAAAGPWRLPEDLAAVLNAVQVADRRRCSTGEDDEARFRQLRYAALSRYDFSGAPGGGGPAGGAVAAAAAETQRLLAVVLAAARPLARIRATHKAALMTALQDLPDGYFATGI